MATDILTRKKSSFIRSLILFREAMKTAHGTIEVHDTSDRSRIRYVSLAHVEEIGWSVVVEKPRR